MTYLFRISIAAAMVLFVNGCLNETQYHLAFPKHMMSNERQVNLFGDINACVVYYFDGNCSFCYSNILSIEKNCPDKLSKLYIYYGTDTSNIYYNIDVLEIPMESCLSDSANCFADANRELLDKPFFLIDSTYTIIGAWGNLDNDLFSLTHQLAECNSTR